MASIHDKVEFCVKAVTYVLGPVAAFLSQVPVSNFHEPKTVLTGVVIGALSLLGFLSRSYSRFRGLTGEFISGVNSAESILISPAASRLVPESAPIAAGLAELKKAVEANVSTNP